LKHQNIFSFRSNAVLQVNINSIKNNLSFLTIPTIKKRTLQVLLKVLIEPYVEPLNDYISFGYRFEKNSNDVTKYLHKKLTHNFFFFYKKLLKQKLYFTSKKYKKEKYNKTKHIITVKKKQIFKKTS
jgi:retron-type reverse transcriptase